MDELLRAAQDDDNPEAASRHVSAASAGETRERAISVDLTSPDEATLQISISDFFPKDGTLVYTIETNTTLEHFTKRTMKVNRKFDDFVWLHERFSENPDLAGNIIPHLPLTISRDQEKYSAQHLIGNPDVASKAKEEVKKRVVQLQKFLRRISQIPHLRTDTNLQAFLEYDELAPRKSPSWFSSSSSGNPKLDSDEQFQRLRQSNTDYQKSISVCLSTYGRLSKSAHAMVDAFNALPDPIKGLRDLDTHADWIRSLTIIADGFKFEKARSAARASSVDEILGELLNDYTGHCSAIGAMHNRRLLLLQRSLTAKDNRIKAEKKALSNPAKQEEVRLLVTMEDAANQSFSAASTTGTVEVTRCRSMRVADFRHALTALAEKEIENAKKEIEGWQSILEQLQM